MLMHELTEKEHKDSNLGGHTERGSSNICMNRNKIVEFFLNHSTDDYLVMVDTDVCFPGDILTRFSKIILEVDKTIPHWNRELYPHIIAGRVDIGSGLPVFYKKFGEGEYREDPRPFRGIKKFDAVGTGIVCISRFCLATMYNESHNPHMFNQAISGGKLTTDDFGFCILAEQHGFKPYGAWDIRGFHQKIQPIMPRYFETVQEFNEFKRVNSEDQLPIFLKDEYYEEGSKRDTANSDNTFTRPEQLPLLSIKLKDSGADIISFKATRGDA
jgi:hypothetical protein